MSDSSYDSDDSRDIPRKECTHRPSCRCDINADFIQKSRRNIANTVENLKKIASKLEAILLLSDKDLVQNASGEEYYEWSVHKYYGEGEGLPKNRDDYMISLADGRTQMLLDEDRKFIELNCYYK
jgi:hypothetical protein